MRTISSEKPLAVVKGNHLGQPQYTINFNVEKTKEGDVGCFAYNTVTLPPGKWDKDTIVDALITEIYPLDKMQAVQNNYLANPSDKEAVSEFSEMQNWRKTAKDMAADLLKG